MTNCPECDANMKIPDDAVEGELSPVQNAAQVLNLPKHPKVLS